MNDLPANSPHPLGYFAAFTLGILCMGVIVLVVRMESVSDAQKRQGAAASGPAETKVRSVFQMPLERPASPPVSARAAAWLPPNGKDNFTRLEEASDSAIAPLALPPDPAPAAVNSLVVERPVVVVAREDSSSGRISGRVVLVGEPPPEKPLAMDAVCAELQPKPPTTRIFTKSKDGGLADVLVSVTKGVPSKKWPVPGSPILLREKVCLLDT